MPQTKERRSSIRGPFDYVWHRESDAAYHFAVGHGLTPSMELMLLDEFALVSEV
jgi:hypothetical protein